MKRHCRSVKHRSLFEGLQDQSSLPVTLARAHTENSFRDKVLKSEIFFARFIAEHNATADHFTGLCKCMFPDSKIAEAFSCARTKTAALVTHALGPAAESVVTRMCHNQPFTILCDGGNDNFDKYFGVLVRLWDENSRKVVVRFLDCPVVNIATGETLFEAINKILEDRAIPWEPSQETTTALPLCLCTRPLYWLSFYNHRYS